MYITPKITASDSEWLSAKNTGLGNVMFQIASCYGLAKTTNRIVVYNNLVKFAHMLKERFGFNHLNTIFRKCLTIENTPFHPIHERDIWAYDKDLIVFLTSNRESVELFGYLECIEYFNMYKHEIVDIFSPDDTSLNIIRNTYPILFHNNYTTISLHFRGNEYINHSVIGKPWDYSFYKRATEYFKENVENPIFLIFSDDMESIDFTFLEGYPYLRMGHTEDYIDMWCISLCHHNIMSKSTFSFWGSYLNKHSDAIIVYDKNMEKPYHTLFTPI